MIGFFNANYGFLKLDLVRKFSLISNYKYLKLKQEVERKLNWEHSLMLAAGFIVDTINAIYILPGYGAFSQNVSIKSIEDLRKNDTYDKTVALMDNEGYEFVLGPAAPTIWSPAQHNGRGLYCKNYEKILESQKNISTKTKYGTMTWIIEDL
jgi:hypothetical protein